MQLKQPIQLNEEFRALLDEMEHGNGHLFITGQAGTGKSTLLRLFQKSTSKKVVVTAPTGVAALNVGGQTIHSFCLFPPALFGPNEVRKGRFKKLYNAMEILIIDEVSMLRVELLDRIDTFLRKNRGRNIPFGGVRLIMFGDLFQLPPVIRREEEMILSQWGYETPYFFSACSLQPPALWSVHELSRVFRQRDDRFLQLLRAIRMNAADEDDLATLNTRVRPLSDEDGLRIILAARNQKVDQINQAKLSSIDNPIRIFMAKSEGQFAPSAYPVESELALKVGTQVMFTRNDSEGAYVNGTLGEVVDMHADGVKVKVINDKSVETIIDVAPVTWEMYKYGEPKPDSQEIPREVVGSFTQLPLRLAWAVTIHKSQGQTFDRMHLDMSGGMFEHGQLYVALSRCRTLEGISLSQPITMRDIHLDEQVVDFYQRMCR